LKFGRWSRASSYRTLPFGPRHGGGLLQDWDPVGNSSDGPFRGDVSVGPFRGDVSRGPFPAVWRRGGPSHGGPKSRGARVTGTLTKRSLLLWSQDSKSPGSCRSDPARVPLVFAGTFAQGPCRSGLWDQGPSQGNLSGRLSPSPFQEALSRGPRRNGHLAAATSEKRGPKSPGLSEGDLVRGILPRGRWHGDLCTAAPFQRPRQKDLAKRTSPKGPRRSDLVAETPLPRGCCHRVLAPGTVPRGPRHGDVVAGFPSQGPCQRHLARGTLPRGSPCSVLVARILAEGSRDDVVAETFSSHARHGKVATFSEGWR